MIPRDSLSAKTGEKSVLLSLHGNAWLHRRLKMFKHHLNIAERSCMSPKSAQRFWGNDMHQNKNLKQLPEKFLHGMTRPEIAEALDLPVQPDA
jgi:hypothetical protein